MKCIFKILTVLLLLFFVSNCYAQYEYKFNKSVIHSNIMSHSKINKSIDVFNSEDYNYYMQLYYLNDTLVARIHDEKHHLAHYFSVDKLDSYNLNYIKTKKRKPQEQYSFKFSEIKHKKKHKEIIFKTYNSKNVRMAKYRLIIKETAHNYLPLFVLPSFELFGNKNIVPPINFMVLETKPTGSSGLRYKLESIEDIDVLVKLSTNLKYF